MLYSIHSNNNLSFHRLLVCLLFLHSFVVGENLMGWDNETLPFIIPKGNVDPSQLYPYLPTMCFFSISKAWGDQSAKNGDSWLLFKSNRDGVGRERGPHVGKRNARGRYRENADEKLHMTHTGWGRGERDWATCSLERSWWQLLSGNDELL